MRFHLEKPNLRVNPVSNYLCRVNDSDWNTRLTSGMRSELTIKTRRSTEVKLEFLLLTLNTFRTLFCFHCWLYASEYNDFGYIFICYISVLWREYFNYLFDCIPITVTNGYHFIFTTKSQQILKYNILQTLLLMYIRKFFYCYLAAPRPTLGHCRGGSLTNLMLITAFYSCSIQSSPGAS